MLGFKLRQRPLPRKGAQGLPRAWHWRFGMDEREECRVGRPDRSVRPWWTRCDPVGRPFHAKEIREMKWIAIVSVAAWLLSPARPAFAATGQPGDASHCRALLMLDDARPYIDCIDAARDRAIAALAAGTHPDAPPTRTSADGPISSEDGEQSVQSPSEPVVMQVLSGSNLLKDGEQSVQLPSEPYQRYENFDGRRQRVAYVSAGEESFLKDEDCADGREGFDCRVLLKPTTSLAGYSYIAFQRRDGIWQWSLISHSTEREYLAVWQTIAVGLHHDFKLSFNDDEGRGRPHRLGPQPIVRTDGDCIQLFTRNENTGLVTEHPRQCG